MVWLGSYLAILLAEVSLLPHLVGTAVPALSAATLVLGIGLQDFRSGFWFVGLAGLLRDIILPGAVLPHTLFGFILFFAMQSFTALAPWDQPLREIAAVGVGLLFLPVAWMGGSLIAAALFDLPMRTLSGADFASRFALREGIFAAVWFSIVVRYRLRRFERRRMAELTWLSRW